MRAWGGPGQGYRVAGVEPRHHARRQGQPVDRRQRRQRRPHPEVHAGRQVRQAVRLRLRERRQQRQVGVQQGREDLARRGGERGLRRRRLRQPPRRVIDMDTGKIKRYWGAYGNKPDDTPLGNYNPDAPLAQQFRTPVHCAEPSNDGIVYVCDRPNDRIQVFTQGRQVREGDAGREDDPRRRIGVGHRVLEGSRRRSTSTSPTARTRRSTSSIARR